MTTNTYSVGLDFGTTNTVITTITPSGERIHHSFNSDLGDSRNFRSLICYWDEDEQGMPVLDHSSGPYGISDYLEWGSDQRLIMSMKNYLGDKSFSRTQILSRQLSIEDMIAHVLQDLLAKTEISLTQSELNVVAGRPVVFAGARADESLALERLGRAFERAGLSNVEFAYEPAAAGYKFGKSGNAKGLVLVADFGGGTSDFSILKLEEGAERRYKPIAHSGVGIAGDRFDAKIFDFAIAPMLGKGSSYDSFGKSVPVPWQPGNFMWHRMALMQNKKDLQYWKSLCRHSYEPEKIKRLVHIIEEGLLFQINRLVLKAKEELSRQQTTVIDLKEIGLDVEIPLSRQEFELCIRDELEKIETSIEDVLKNAEIESGQIDQVFMTGGTSHTPAVRQIFIDLFGADKIRGGNEFSSVADGLAEMAFDKFTANYSHGSFG
ncbi:MAG: Hsp70 family protein [Sneathiella sp.]|nr:Hsp70 family protein [Sneathiella sp.]